MEVLRVVFYFGEIQRVCYTLSMPLKKRKTRKSGDPPKAIQPTLPFSPVMTVFVVAALGLGIALPVVSTMRANQRKPLLAVDLRTCEPKRAQKALPYGSVTVDVLGKNPQGCSLAVTDEVEMGQTVYRCTYPKNTRTLTIWTYANPEKPGIFWTSADRSCVRQ